MSSYKKQAIKIQGLQIIDAFLVWCGFALAYVVRDPVMSGINELLKLLRRPLILEAVGTMGDISSLLVVIVPFTPLILELTGFYRNSLQASVVRTVARIFTAVALMVCAVGLLSLFFKINASSRSMLIIAAGIIALLLLCRFVLMRSYWRRKSKREKIKESIVLAGEPMEVERLFASMQQDETMRWRVVGRYDLASGKWDDFQNLLHDEAVERVIFAAKHSEFDKIATAVEMCGCVGLRRGSRRTSCRRR